jgi:hypothetical protein
MFCVFTTGREEKIASSLRTETTITCARQWVVVAAAVVVVVVVEVLTFDHHRCRLAGVPLLAVRKNCLHFGTKSGSREAFLRTGVPHPQVRFLPTPLPI